METLINNFIKAIGWSIFHSLWQGALIYGILLVIVMGIPKLSSRIKHNLAYSALCLMFTGFCVTFFSLFRLTEQATDLAPAGQYLALAYTQYLSELPPRWSVFAEGMFPYIVAMYGLGLMVQTVVLLSGYRKIKRLKHAGRLQVPAAWAIAFEEIKNTLKISRTIGFYLSSYISVPLVIGYIKPVVLFPVALATQMDLKQVEAILIHELSHIRRNDYLFNLAKTVMETVLFFNPFIWLSGKFINIEREHACDDLVLKHTGTPLTYAHALLKLELLKSKDTPLLSLAATGKPQHLYQRIKRITDMKTNYMNAKQRLLAISLTLATIISLAWVSPLKSESMVDNAKAKVNNMMNAPIFEPVQEISEVVRKEASAVLPNQDTTKKKTKIRIVTTDEKGNTKEYNSLKEMPDSLRREVMVRVIPGPHGSGKLTDSLIIRYKKMLPERMDRNFDSSESGKIVEDARKKVEEIRKYYSSPEWKKQVDDIVKNAKESAKNAKEIDIRVNTPEFRTMFHDLRIDDEIHKVIQKNISGIKEKFNSEEWKKQMEELKEFHNSKEYKELKEKQKKELDKLKKKKGIKTDINNYGSVSFSPGVIRIAGTPSINILPDLSVTQRAAQPNAPVAPKAPSSQ